MAETLPPLTAADVKTALSNPTFSVYLYIGKDTDKGWKVARAAFGLLPILRIYLVDKADLIPAWRDGPGTRGVVFGFGPTPKRHLKAVETEDIVTVIDAINTARQG